eukprot:1154811-Pelagomonas_calceolata.AAC.2
MSLGPFIYPAFHPSTFYYNRVVIWIARKFAEAACMGKGGLLSKLKTSAVNWSHVFIATHNAGKNSIETHTLELLLRNIPHNRELPQQLQKACAQRGEDREAMACLTEFYKETFVHA